MINPNNIQLVSIAEIFKHLAEFNISVEMNKNPVVLTRSLSCHESEQKRLEPAPLKQLARLRYWVKSVGVVSETLSMKFLDQWVRMTIFLQCCQGDLSLSVGL